MIDVTANNYKTKLTIELDREEADGLLEALDFYLSDMDRNESADWYGYVRDLRDRIKQELK